MKRTIFMLKKVISACSILLVSNYLHAMESNSTGSRISHQQQYSFDKTQLLQEIEKKTIDYESLENAIRNRQIDIREPMDEKENTLLHIATLKINIPLARRIIRYCSLDAFLQQNKDKQTPLTILDAQIKLYKIEKNWHKVEKAAIIRQFIYNRCHELKNERPDLDCTMQ